MNQQHCKIKNIETNTETVITGDITYVKSINFTWNTIWQFSDILPN